jgi:hypothetical protein
VNGETPRDAEWLEYDDDVRPPTAWAYKQACDALAKAKIENERLRGEVAILEARLEKAWSLLDKALDDEPREGK